MSNYKISARAQRVRENSEGVAFVQDGKITNIKDIDCWHCSKKGQYCSNCPNLRVKGIDDGVQNFTLNFEECNDSHGLFSADKLEECMLMQAKGIALILLPDHLYIDNCVSYPSTPHVHLLDNLRKQS